jgi:hypothetical protein
LPLDAEIFNTLLQPFACSIYYNEAINNRSVKGDIMLADSQIYKTVQRSNTTTIILSIIALGIVGVLAYMFFVPYWMAQYRDPIELDDDALEELDPGATMYNVTVDGRDLVPGIGTYETTENGRTTSIEYYHALRIKGDTYLLIFAPDDLKEDDTEFSGTLMPIDSDTQVEIVDFTINDAASSNYEIEFLPVMLDVRHNETMWYLGTGGLAVLALGGLWGLGNFISRSSNPAKHPTLRRLSRFGEVEKVVDSIEKDLATGEDKMAKLRLSKNWLVNSGGNSFEAMPYHSIAWVYKMIQQGRYGKTYYIHIYDKTGVGIIIQDKEMNVNAMIQAVAARTPWVILGYSNDIKRNWDKNRPGFIAEVDARYAQFSQQQ